MNLKTLLIKLKRLFLKEYSTNNVNGNYNTKKFENIREAELNDAKFIAIAIEKACNEKHFCSKIAATKVRQIINPNKKDGIMLIVEYGNNQKAGFAYYGKNAKYDKQEINLLYIKEEFRNKGLATSIIKYCECHILPCPIFVRCDVDYSKEAISLFQKLGYKESPQKETAGKHTLMILEKNFY